MHTVTPDLIAQAEELRAQAWVAYCAGDANDMAASRRVGDLDGWLYVARKCGETRHSLADVARAA